MTVFPRYTRLLSPRIVKTVNINTANSEGRAAWIYYELKYALVYNSVVQRYVQSRQRCGDRALIVATFQKINFSFK